MPTPAYAWACRMFQLAIPRPGDENSRINKPVRTHHTYRCRSTSRLDVTRLKARRTPALMIVLRESKGINRAVTMHTTPLTCVVGKTIYGVYFVCIYMCAIYMQRSEWQSGLGSRSKGYEPPSSSIFTHVLTPSTLSRPETEPGKYRTCAHLYESRHLRSLRIT